MVRYQRRALNSRFAPIPLKRLLKKAPQYGANEEGQERIHPEQPRYIRITDIDEYGLLRNDLGATANNFEEKYKLHHNDLLIARSGATVGKAYLHKSSEVNYDCFFAGYMIRFILDDNLVNPDFVFVFTQTNTYAEWARAIQRPTGQPNINAEEYKSLPIPLPPLEVQDRAVELFHKAYGQKKSKESEATSLLANIDEYLLSELRVALSEPSDNNIKKRIFYRSNRQLSGERFDAPYHSAKQPFVTKKYPLVRFADHLHINPQTPINLPTTTEVTFLPMESISETFGDVATPETRPLSEAGGYTVFTENDLLWAKITPCMENGKTAMAYNLKNGFGFGSTEFNVFRLKNNNVDIRYIHGLLRMKMLRAQAKLYFGGSAGHQRVADIFFKRLLIPLPPLQKQIDIANMISNMMNKAKQLQHEASEELEKAKQEVERMILSGS